MRRLVLSKLSPPKALFYPFIKTPQPSLHTSTPLFNSRKATAQSPLPQRYLSHEELENIVALLEKDPLILLEVVENLEPENRRRLIVAGGAIEWFGKESAAREVQNADVDKDMQISPKDFDHWFENALRRKQEGQKKKSAEMASGRANEDSAPSASSSSETKNGGDGDSTTSSPIGCGTAQAAAARAGNATGQAASGSTSRTKKMGAAAIPLSALCLIALEAGLPFVGFGFLDNATMILAGDFIDGTLGFYLGCSVLASAAMGNVCSGVLGMQVHGLIDKAVQKLNFNTPVLSEEQLKGRQVFFAGHLGGTIGIMIGLILGMLPLLFIDTDANEKTDYAMFQKWDVNNSGFVEMPELEKVLGELGLSDTKENAEKLMRKYGKNYKVNFEQFCEFKDDLREGKPIFE